MLKKLRVKVEQPFEGGKYFVYTSVDQNGWWGLGVSFTRSSDATQLAKLLLAYAERNGYTAEIGEVEMSFPTISR